MKVILSRDVPSLGRAGVVVEVKEGYARNYLFPRGLAVEATEGRMRALARERAAGERRIAREREEAARMAAALTSTPLVIAARGGSQGRLFGAVTAQDIADALRQRGFAISKKQIALDDPIKVAGSYSVTVHLDHSQQARVQVIVEVRG
ncbi:MAG: 50S ribosomal protein L9 [Armatimonadota bacterium]|nr:50S ribosomal protein L9 [Armatimonadota bacterium]MDR5696772.1 50S ribosomal protein L9 [Armatimonadota bacterium]